MNKLSRGDWKFINKWYNNGDDKILNLICEPYGDLELIYTFIDERVKNNEKVLYISKNKNNIKELNDYKSIINIIDFNHIYKVKELYSLIIMDDITCYSDKSDIELAEDVSFLIKRCQKFILCSASEVLKNVITFVLGNLKRKTHFIEPRIISTRLDLRNSMPYILYDYFKWFNKQRRNLIVYVSSEKKGNELLKYYTKVLNMQKDVYLICSHNKELINDINRLKYKDKSFIIITNELHNYLDFIESTDVMFYFADEKFFTYKEIIYACGSLTKDEQVSRELILVCNDETNTIEYSKGITRRYNKFIWERE